VLHCCTVSSANSPIGGTANTCSSSESHELMFTRKNFSGRHLADLYVTAFPV